MITVAWQLPASVTADASRQPGSAGLTEERAVGVSALGRIEPRSGIIRVAGPARPAAVIAELRVEEGDRVDEGQILAILDDEPQLAASVARLNAEVRDAENQSRRFGQLHRDGIVSTVELEAADLKLEVTRAELSGARAQLDLARVKAPVAGLVLDVFAHRGERIGAEGVALVASTEEMDVLAEVYETDVAGIAPGSEAMISSPVIGVALRGHVDRIGRLVGKQTVLADDPGAAADRRIVEVRIALEQPEQVAALTNLQVDVAFAPLPGGETKSNGEER